MSVEILLEDNFEGGDYNLSEGGTSPNGEWKNIYNGYGSSGVHDVQAPSTRSGNVFFLSPQVNPNGTSATLVRTVDTFNNFSWTVYMRTISQHHSPNGANWETAWLMWRYTDNTHHYCMMIKKDGTIEITGKDYEKIGTTQIKTPDGVVRNISELNPQSQDQQFFLSTGINATSTNGANNPALVFGQWYKVRIEHVNNTIKVWVNDVHKLTVSDDGNTGSWLGANKTFAAGPQMGSGHLALYVEDALVEYDSTKVGAR